MKRLTLTTAVLAILMAPAAFAQSTLNTTAPGASQETKPGQTNNNLQNPGSNHNQRAPADHGTDRSTARRGHGARARPLHPTTGTGTTDTTDHEQHRLDGHHHGLDHHHRDDLTTAPRPARYQSDHDQHRPRPAPTPAAPRPPPPPPARCRRRPAICRRWRWPASWRCSPLSPFASTRSGMPKQDAVRSDRLRSPGAPAPGDFVLRPLLIRPYLRHSWTARRSASPGQPSSALARASPDG